MARGGEFEAVQYVNGNGNENFDVHPTLLHDTLGTDQNGVGLPVGPGTKIWKGFIQSFAQNGTMYQAGGGVAGFKCKFHYNPQQVSISTVIDDNSDHTMNDVWAALGPLYQMPQHIGFTLRFNRIPDMTIPPQAGDVMKRGTLHDIDFLYRTQNGAGAIADLGLGGDYGILMPNLIQVWFSPNWSIRGYMESVNVRHQVFTQQMVPTLTDVDISMVRFSDYIPAASAGGAK